MFHLIELLSILSLIALGEGVLLPGPHAARRVVLSAAGWVLAFAAGITILAISPLAATAVRLGLLLLAVCVVRYGVGELTQFLHGPELIAPPKAAELRELAQQVSALPERESAAVARRVARRQDGTVALLGLLAMGAKEGIAKDVFERTWQESSEKARALAMRVAEQRAEIEGRGHAGAGDVRFVAQALCLYEQDSVERVLARLPADRKGRSGRIEAVRQLARSGKGRKEAARLGLIVPSEGARGGAVAARRAPGDHAEPGIEPLAVLWPPISLARAGFGNRAIALAISHGVLVVYGATAAICGRSSGWVFLAAALLIHVQGVLAAGDFREPAARAAADVGAEDGGQP